MAPKSFKRRRFSPEIIQHAVWLYARFTLSFRDVEELLAERGIDVSNETLRRWFLKFGRQIAVNLRSSRPRASARWHLDEMVIKIRSRKYWLWRAVDDEGEVLDFLVQRRRCARSAGRSLRKLLKKQGFAPDRITTDKLRSYAVAIRAERLIAVHDQGLRANNRAEIHTSPFDDESENSSGSSHQVPPNASFRSTPPSTTPFTSNVIFCRATLSKYFDPRLLWFGIKTGLPPNPDRDQILLTAGVNVSMPRRAPSPASMPANTTASFSSASTSRTSSISIATVITIIATRTFR